MLRDDCGGDEGQPAIKHNLRWFRFDGIFAQASDSIILAYLSLFVLALGASRAQIGLMSALASLSAALVLLPGAILAERWGHRKTICLLGGGGAARFALFLMVLAPLALSGPAVITFFIALVVVRSAFIHIGIPAWTSLTADIVPLSGRGRYFSSRNIVMGAAGLVTTYAAGQLITMVGAPMGYQLALAFAFGLGLVSTFSFSRIQEPPATRVQSDRRAGSAVSLLRRVHAHPDFLALCITAGMWNLSLGVAAPFFNVYLVESLGASASVVGILTVLAALAALPGQRLFGVLVDRWGPRRVQLVTGLIIPLVPWGWAISGSPWHLVPMQLAGGFLWAGYGLASFNFLLLLIPEDRRSRYTALYQIVVTLALAGGAALGGLFATHWGYLWVFIITGVGRLLAAVLFARFVRQSDSTVFMPSASRDIRTHGAEASA